mmetsp:Transcript_36982/g.116335  ORF Transcript_36982/g.116335 Transcript_36982/m.116335 type:complete len:295 (+) Transcript_36982:84-968(+)
MPWSWSGRTRAGGLLGAALLVVGALLVALPRLGSPGGGAPRDEAPGWRALHNLFLSERSELVARLKGKPLDMLFVGDSITEAWRGTSYGKASACYAERCNGIEDVFAEHFGGMETARFAISGDRSDNLLWRLRQGEADGLNPRVVVVLIGTNDLGKAFRMRGASAAAVYRAVPGAAGGIRAVVDELRTRAPQAHILVLGLLPRGERHTEGLSGIQFMQPSVFTRAIGEVNSRAQLLAGEDEHVHYVDCSTPFLSEDGNMIRKALMRDALHPTAEGHEEMARCIEGAAAPYLKEV